MSITLTMTASLSNTSRQHSPDQQRVDVVLQVGHLLALALHRALQPHQHLYQVLPTPRVLLIIYLFAGLEGLEGLEGETRQEVMILSS